MKSGHYICHKITRSNVFNQFRDTFQYEKMMAINKFWKEWFVIVMQNCGHTEREFYIDSSQIQTNDSDIPPDNSISILKKIKFNFSYENNPSLASAINQSRTQSRRKIIFVESHVFDTRRLTSRTNTRTTYIMEGSNFLIYFIFLVQQINAECMLILTSFP